MRWIDGTDHPRVELSYTALEDLLGAIFLKAGASDRVARILARNCAGCERDGAASHGIFRMRGYVSSIRSGWVDPAAEPEIEDVGAAFVRVDAMNGFAQPALEAAFALVLDKVERSGAAVLAIRNSHHFSALWPDVEPFAEKGLLALTMVNSFACAVPFDGRRAVLGTNPIAFAAPRDGAPPLVADMATTTMANGDVQIARREGRRLPPGQGVDRNGEPTTDPAAVLDGGALLTFGGYKGSTLSLMIELFCAALTGGDFSFEVDWSDYPGAQTPHTGQVIIVVDPDRGRRPAFAARTESLLARLTEAGVSRLPGDRRLVNRRRSLAGGISLAASDLDELRQLAE